MKQWQIIVLESIAYNWELYIFVEKKNKWTVDNFCLIFQGPDKLFARDLLEFELLLQQELCCKEKYKLSAIASNRAGRGKMCESRNFNYLQKCELGMQSLF